MQLFNYSKSIRLWLILLLFANVARAGAQTTTELPALKVSGKQLVDPTGKAIQLHGVMDTPNRYFNGWRWQSWKPGYDTADIPPCLTFFEKIFTAITDKSQGSYCNVFRLHMDPCWTNSGNATNEADISKFSLARYKTFLNQLYIPLIKKALAHGLYVIVRPPGVCPQNIKVGDGYQNYLKTVWREFAQHEEIKALAGKVSIELANEPVNVYSANGVKYGYDYGKGQFLAPNALHDFFQPVVDVIRQAGFTGIIWVPGAGYQSNYVGYKEYPISDNNFGYAVHVYSGWYGNITDNNCNPQTFITNFHNDVPVVDFKPVMVTEIDWSPEDPGRTSEGHYNEWNQWVVPNFGSWATGSTSKWGAAWKAVHDHFGNIGMTLTHTHDYLDIDEYLANGTVRPAFQNAKKYNLFEECCAYACFQWYKEWWEKQQNASGIGSVASSQEVAHTYYYNIRGERVEKPQKGVYIIKQVLKDGTVRNRKVLSSK